MNSEMSTTPSDSRHDMPPVEGFEPIEYSGRGGQGEVWRAKHLTGTEVAVKFQHSHLASDPKAAERFVAEAQIAHQLYPLGSLAVCSEVQGRRFFTMRWMEGISLMEASAQGLVDDATAVRYIRDVARHLQMFHASGRAHRDIKPSNIMIAPDGEARLMDFGLARELTRKVPLTTVGAPMGTLEYMSPEQVLGERVDERSDIFSLGVTFYELLAFVNPFFADERERRAKNIAFVSHQPLPDHVPQPLHVILDRCLAKRPAARFQSARELADNLDLYLRGEPIFARPESAVVKSAYILARHGLWAVAAFGVGMAAVSMVWPSNEFAASKAAGDALGYFQQWARHLDANAHSAALLSAIQTDDQPALQGLMRKFCRGNRLPGTTATLLSGAGLMLARCPEMAEMQGANYDFRDYFQGALQRLPEDSPHVSSIYASTKDGSIRFAVSTAIRDAAGAVVGVLGAAYVASEGFDRASIEKERGYELVVVGSWDPAPPPGDQSPPPADARGVVVVHPSFAKASSRQWLKDDFGGVATRASRWFNDPARRRGNDLDRWDESDGTWYWDHVDRGPLRYLPWRAGLAPVGHTGLVAIVRSRSQLWTSFVWLGFASVVAASAWSKQKKRNRFALLTASPGHS